MFAVLYVLGVDTTAVHDRWRSSPARSRTGRINRRWTWKVEGRVAFGREVVAYMRDLGHRRWCCCRWPPTGPTIYVQRNIQPGTASGSCSSTGSYFAVLAVLYGVRFFLYEHWIFSGRSRVRAALRSRRQVWIAARANRTP